jgi:hypothetical protein
LGPAAKFDGPLAAPAQAASSPQPEMDLSQRFAQYDADVIARLLEFDSQLENLDKAVKAELEPVQYPDMYDARILELLRKV